MNDHDERFLSELFAPMFGEADSATQATLLNVMFRGLKTSCKRRWDCQVGYITEQLTKESVEVLKALVEAADYAKEREHELASEKCDLLKEKINLQQEIIQLKKDRETIRNSVIA